MSYSSLFCLKSVQGRICTVSNSNIMPYLHLLCQVSWTQRGLDPVSSTATHPCGVLVDSRGMSDVPTVPADCRKSPSSLQWLSDRIRMYCKSVYRITAADCWKYSSSSSQLWLSERGYSNHICLNFTFLKTLGICRKFI